ncbi:hypothetical protein IEQ34_002862 [Dendrobium chrysotoxum]|uniref:Protein kinase domain-containing protein n=1 Tax=Dendrobium chrysotoxum TaxID=161865 RepID=A0AAV7HI70_DENCH|nr:hypothetical protein IEQ34_002862 [Dendrobium chrysotoxum]
MYHNGSSGGFGKHGKSGDIYQEVLENGSHVVMKRIDMGTVNKEAYQVEFDFCARFSHERLVPFVGHCMENENERFLVYKQMPHRDLANALYRKAAQDWITSLKIATSTTEALCYLHHECEPPLVVGDVANVFGIQEAEGTGVGDGEGEAMAAELGIFLDDGEGEGGREGKEGVVSGVLETDGDTVQCVAD